MVKMISKNKKGLSIVVSYVLLIGISIGLSVLVYTWMKNYTPRESLECPDGTSMSIVREIYNCSTGILNLTLKNNGRFSIYGFYIKGSNKTADLSSISELDLSNDLMGEEERKSLMGNLVAFGLSVDNIFKPSSNNVPRAFNLSKYGGAMKKIEIIPVRYQVISNKNTLVQCSNSRIQEILNCS